MKKIIVLFFCFITSNASRVYCQEGPTYHLKQVNKVSYKRIVKNLNQFEKLGLKYRNTVAQENTLLWLKEKYIGFGYNSAEIREDTFSYENSTCKNLVITKRGTKFPETYVIVGGHYDTRDGSGTSDNGSGAVVLLEMAKIVQKLNTEYSVIFIHFSGEEEGWYGSKAFVKNVVNATQPKMNIKLMFNIDGVGGLSNHVNDTVVCERDEVLTTLTNNAASDSMNMQLMKCVKLYSTLVPAKGYITGSDYMPFEANNEVVVGLYQEHDSKFFHTPNDLLINMDTKYNYQVARAAIGALLHFAVVK